MEYLIIGASAAGIAAVEAIRSKDQEGRIAVITDEDYHFYSRCMLSYYLAGSITEDKLKYRDDGFAEKNKVSIIKGLSAKEIIPGHKVKLSDGREIGFDKLLIASGSRPNFDNIPGIEKKGVFGFRNIKDAENIMTLSDKTDSAVMLGGGLIGLKAAYALSCRGLKVTVVVRSDFVLSQMLDGAASAFVREVMESKGIRVLTGRFAKEISGKDSVEAVILDNGEEIKTKIAVVGKGVIPNTEIAKTCGLRIGRGIIVDEYMRTSSENIYAVGDVAETNDLIKNERTINALWPNAVSQGRIAGLNMTGAGRVYDGSMAMNSLDFFGFPVIAYGVTNPKEKGLEILSFIDRKKKIYKKIVLKDNAIAGLILAGEIENAGVYGSLIRKKADVSAIKEQLLDRNFGFADILSLVSKMKEKFTEQEYDEYRI